MNPTARRLALQELYGLVHEAATGGALRHVSLIGLPVVEGMALARDLAQMLQGAGRRLVVVEADLSTNDPLTAAVRQRFALARESDADVARLAFSEGLKGLVSAARIGDAVTLLAGLLGATRTPDGEVVPGLEPDVVRGARFRARAVKTALNLLRYDAARTPHLFLVPAHPSARLALELAVQLVTELRERPVCVLTVGGTAPELGVAVSVVRVGGHDAGRAEPSAAPKSSKRSGPAEPAHAGRAGEAPATVQQRPLAPHIVASPATASEVARLPSVTQLALPPEPSASPAALAGAPLLREALGRIPDGAWAQVSAAQAGAGPALTLCAAHRIVADWLEGHSPHDSEARAHHLALGERPELAAELLLREARVADAARALALVPRGHVTLGRRVAGVAAALGEAWANTALLQSALPWLEPSPLRVLAARQLGLPVAPAWADATTPLDVSRPLNTNELDQVLWWASARLGDADPQSLPAAVLCLERALKAQRALEGRPGEGRVLLALALIRADEGKLAPATGLFEEALAALEREPAPALVAGAWLGLHAVRRARGEEQAADDALGHAAEAAPQGHPVATRVALAEATQLILLNRLDEARALLEAIPEWGAYDLDAERLAALASLAAAAGQTGRARELGRAALQKARVAAHPAVLARALLAGAQSHTVALFSPGSDSGQGAALPLLNEAVHVLESTGRHRELLGALEALARCCLESGDMGGARAATVRGEALRRGMVPTDHAERAMREARTIRRTYSTSPIAAQDVSSILSQISAPTRKSRVDL